MSSIVDASRAFAQRRAISEIFHDGVSPEDVLVVARSAAINVVDEVVGVNPEVERLLYPDADGLDIKVVSPVDPSEPGVASLLESNRVHYHLDQHPTLHLTPSLFSALEKLLQPYHEHIDTEELSTRGSQIIDVAARIGMASWVFDKIDPRRVGHEINADPSLVEASLEVGLKDCRIVESGPDITMDILRYRFIGYLGFESLLGDSKFATVQQVFQAYFDRSVESDSEVQNDPAFSLRFIMAHPLSMSEAHGLIDQLMFINDVVGRHK